MALGHERVIDDISILEAALERATERKSGLSPQPASFAFTPGRELRQEIRSEAAFGDGQASAVDRERFGKSVSSYSTQLKAWVDMQVDARLQLVLVDVENELNVARKECRSAFEMATLQQDRTAKLEQLMLSADTQTRRETAELQQETLTTVADLMRTVDELKRSFSQEQRAEIEELRSRLAGQEDKLGNWRADLIAEMGAEMRAVEQSLVAELRTVEQKGSGLHRETRGSLETLHRETRGSLEGQLEGLRGEVSSVARQSDLQELQLLFEKAQRRMGDDLLAHQQRLMSELRQETTTAIKHEAAAVTALDEQVWQTDQRLGQRIDKVASGVRDCSVSIDDIVRSHNDIQRSHQESMTRIKGLATSHREFIRSRSPEHHKVVNISERERVLRSCSPRKYEDRTHKLELRTLASLRSAELVEEARHSNANTPAGLEARERRIHAGARSPDEDKFASDERRNSSPGGLAMAQLAGETLDVISHQQAAHSYSARGHSSRATARQHQRDSNTSSNATGSIAMARVAGDAFADIVESSTNHRPPPQRR